jgi:hypothetical protein
MWTYPRLFVLFVTVSSESVIATINAIEPWSMAAAVVIAFAVLAVGPARVHRALRRASRAMAIWSGLAVLAVMFVYMLLGFDGDFWSSMLGVMGAWTAMQWLWARRRPQHT